MTHPELYILRHGETVWNAEGRLQGWDNSALTAKGEMQAARQFELLRSRDLSGFQAVSSPAGRAVQTAGIAVAPLLPEIRTDPRLKEIGVGDWSGRLRSELPEYRESEDLLIAQYDRAPNGEGLERLEARVRDFLTDLDGPTVLVTHGITSRMIRAILVDRTCLDLSTPNGGQGVVWHVRGGTQHLLR